MRGMDKLSIILVSVVTQSTIEIVASTSPLTENYVTTNKTKCSAKLNQLKHPCLTLQVYERQPDNYFTNNTIFYFGPGRHTLNRSLELARLHNFTFQGLPDDGQVVVIFSALVNITWENCSNITLSSIVFTFNGNFVVGLAFINTLRIQLVNMSVASSNGVNGNSSIRCHRSDVVIKNCNFTGIQGSHGAAMFISESCANFTGNNIFVGNTASYYGGSLYIIKSKIVLFNGSNNFTNNNSSTNFKFNYTITPRENYFARGSGGAIYSKFSHLTINSESIFTNNSAQYHGGAIAAEDGEIFVLGPCIILFERNTAQFGGSSCTLQCNFISQWESLIR